MDLHEEQLNSVVFLCTVVPADVGVDHFFLPREHLPQKHVERARPPIQANADLQFSLRTRTMNPKDAFHVERQARSKRYAAMTS